jgi:hypothetical protein
MRMILGRHWKVLREPPFLWHKQDLAEGYVRRFMTRELLNFFKIDFLLLNCPPKTHSLNDVSKKPVFGIAVPMQLR